MYVCMYIYISVINQIDAQEFVLQHVYFNIALYSLRYHHTYRCDDTWGCIMQFWPPDDEHMCSKHVEAWNKLIVKHNFVHQFG